MSSATESSGSVDERARPLDQCQRRVRPAGVERGLGGEGKTVAAAPSVLAQFRRPLEGSRRGGLRPSRQRLHPGRLELGGDSFVGALDDQRPVPGASDLI